MAKEKIWVGYVGRVDISPELLTRGNVTYHGGMELVTIQAAKVMIYDHRDSSEMAMDFYLGAGLLEDELLEQLSQPAKVLVMRNGGRRYLNLFTPEYVKEGGCDYLLSAYLFPEMGPFEVKEDNSIWQARFVHFPSWDEEIVAITGSQRRITLFRHPDVWQEFGSAREKG